MAVRSMTGFAQVTGQIDDQLGFTLSLKSVNHRFLDLHFRMPPDDALEMQLRRALKEKLGRGHVELTLTVERVPGQGVAFNLELVRDYVTAFRAAAVEFGLNAEPDLNAIFRVPGALEAAGTANADGLAPAVMAKLDEALRRLNDMRAEEGRGIERELRERMAKLRADNAEVIKHRNGVLRGYMEKLRGRMQELLANQGDPDRLLQEAALLADRSDIQEEVARMDTHIQHFLGLIEAGGEAGKKLDFLLQEMNREANTLLSKTSGIAGEALRITELGLRMKSEIEKAREQALNIE